MNRRKQEHDNLYEPHAWDFGGKKDQRKFVRDTVVKYQQTILDENGKLKEGLHFATLSGFYLDELEWHQSHSSFFKPSQYIAIDREKIDLERASEMGLLKEHIHIGQLDHVLRKLNQKVVVINADLTITLNTCMKDMHSLIQTLKNCYEENRECFLFITTVVEIRGSNKIKKQSEEAFEYLQNNKFYHDYFPEVKEYFPLRQEYISYRGKNKYGTKMMCFCLHLRPNAKAENQNIGNKLFRFNNIEPYVDVKGKLREPQASMIPEIINALRTGKDVELVLPPGGGKSLIKELVAEFITIDSEWKKLVVIIAPKLGILENFKPTEQRTIYDAKYTLTKAIFKEIRVNGKSKSQQLIDFITEFNGKNDLVISCTHSTAVRSVRYIKDRECLKNVIFFIDEGQHVAIDESDNHNRMGELVRAIKKAGGQYVSSTATDFRADGRKLVAGECTSIKKTYSDLLHGYKRPYVANQSMSIHFYSYEEDKILNEWMKCSTDFNPIATDIRALIKEYVKVYSELRRPTLMNVPQGSIKNSMKSCEIAVEIENELKRVCPWSRILNLGGVIEKGVPVLTSESSKNREYQRAVKERPNDFDVIIQIQIMNEGLDWPLCRYTFCCGVTHNDGLFIQRDMGRGARLKIGDNYHHIIYFVPGLRINERHTKEYEEAIQNLKKQFVHYQSLIVNGANYSEAVSLHLRFDDKKKEIRIPLEIGQKIVNDLMEYAIVTDMEENIKSIMNFVVNHRFLEGYTLSAKIELVGKIYKIDNSELMSAVEVTEKQYKKRKAIHFKKRSNAFNIWWELFLKNIGDICLEEDIIGNGIKFMSQMTDKDTMKYIKTLWTKDFYCGFKEWEEWMFENITPHGALQNQADYLKWATKGWDGLPPRPSFIAVYPEIIYRKKKKWM